MLPHPVHSFPLGLTLSIAVGLAAFTAAPAYAGVAYDQHGNVGYDSADECDAAVNAGSARFYESYTTKSALLRRGETGVSIMRLSDVAVPRQIARDQGDTAIRYTHGACDLGSGSRMGRDGVAKELQGKFVPFGPEMLVNVYTDSNKKPVRIAMRQCDNWFSAAFPRPVSARRPAPVAAAAPQQPVQMMAPSPYYYYYAAPVVTYAVPYVVAPAAIGGYGYAYGGGRGRRR
jgi:hypothetical protein